MSVLQAEVSICEICGRLDELRPYGPDGKKVCFPCGAERSPFAEAFLEYLNNPRTHAAVHVIVDIFLDFHRSSALEISDEAMAGLLEKVIIFFWSYNRTMPS